jgi:hypothetical protein
VKGENERQLIDYPSVVKGENERQLIDYPSAAKGEVEEDSLFSTFAFATRKLGDERMFTD